jgi:hypothetical protein
LIIMRRRRSIRLRGFDYSRSGVHFVTICAHERSCVFGVIAKDEMRLNEYGLIVTACWQDLPNHYPFVELDAFVVMPTSPFRRDESMKGVTRPVFRCGSAIITNALCGAIPN